LRQAQRNLRAAEPETEPAALFVVAELGHRAVNKELNARELSQLGTGFRVGEAARLQFLLAQDLGQVGALDHDEPARFHQGGREHGGQSAADVPFAVLGRERADRVELADGDRPLRSRRRRQLRRQGSARPASVGLRGTGLRQLGRRSLIRGLVLGGLAGRQKRHARNRKDDGSQHVTAPFFSDPRP
jgi:hypothetical protein